MNMQHRYRIIAVGLLNMGFVISAAAVEVVDLAKTMKRSLVKITQEGREGVDGLGTGFVVSEDGLIATNLHVIGEARRLRVELADGRKLKVEVVHATDARTDLALLKVAARDLEPLNLGDSEQLEQGERLVAMGNPEGLEFSVVEGVVSAIRELEIEGVPMIQVALPIERGNSGGPVLNSKGEVVGVLTLKSLRTDNLGFAMPIHQLKKLIAKPNPVPMDRWLTIGVLDRRQWEVLMGGQWSQRAGVIRAVAPGDGFGGRTLCLTAGEAPQEEVYEVEVEVKLRDESGAAGLAFCADGGDRHYGFYPSGGKLRLTRFDGPSVYEWTVLSELVVPAYRAGDWNELRVRVDAEGLVGWVNQVEVVRIADKQLRGGRAGLCKFRDTVAEFRHYQIGADLAKVPISDETAEQVRLLMKTAMESDRTADKLAEHYAANPREVGRLLLEERRQMEKQIATLKKLESELHRTRVANRLLEELAKPESEIQLLRCALLISQHDNPNIEVENYERAFAAMAKELADDPQIAAGTANAVTRINTFLFDENGFHGSRHDYYNRSNSYLSDVLDDREGLPIALSVLYLELAKVLKVAGVFGVALPGKFMVGFHPSPEDELELIDVFERGRLMTVREAEKELNRSAPFDSEILQPAGKREMVLRMIRNLLGSALDEPLAAKVAIPYLDLYLKLDPDSAAERFARARFRQIEGDAVGARSDVNWLIDHSEGIPAALLKELEAWRDRLLP